MSDCRVLLVAPMANWIFQNLVPSLRRLCTAVYAYPFGNNMGNWHLPNWAKRREQLAEQFISDVRELVHGPGLDLVLTVVYDDALSAKDIRRLRDMGVRVVTYHVDMFGQWYRVLKHAPMLDLLAVSHMQNLEPFIRRGVPLHCMPMAASPDRYAQPPREDVPAHGVLMLGSASESRAAVVAACLEVHDRVDVYGVWEKFATATNDVVPEKDPPRKPGKSDSWLAKRRFDLPYAIPRLMAEGTSFFGRQMPSPSDPHAWEKAAQANFHGYARETDVPSLMARADIVLGVNQRLGRLGERNSFADSRLRDFEAPMSGAFYLVQSFIDLPLFYKPGVEVETYQNLEELKRKVKYYLDHKQQRRSIADAGRERALNEHTWDVRLEALLHRLSLTYRKGRDSCTLRVVRNASSKPWCADSPGCQTSQSADELRPQLQVD
jgi:spore maturation protein CgeB